MRVVFMGTPEFAIPSLLALSARHDVVAVYTRPDAPAGRGRRTAASAVKMAAEQLGLVVEQPHTLREPGQIARLSAYDPTVVVVAAYGVILPREVIELPPMGCMNVHASLLPRWRGAAPVQWAILAGDPASGVSIMRMEEGLDTGPYCVQEQVPVDELTATELTRKLAQIGAEALVKSLDDIAAGTARWTAQDEACATYARKVTADDVALEPGLTVDAALRRVRAGGPSAPCRVKIGGRRLVVTAARRGEAVLPPGEAECGTGLVLGLTDGAVSLEAVIPEGRSAMSAAAFARGARLGARCSWGAA